MLTLVTTLLPAGALGATLGRMAPGFGVQGSEFGPRLNRQSLERLCAERRLEGGLFCRSAEDGCGPLKISRVRPIGRERAACLMALAQETYSFLGMPAVIASAPMRRLLRLVRRAALSDASVLITGESGTGKELIARALHHYSARASRPWIDVCCAALPEHLIESELFGHEKGAFSGADTAKPGLFELAEGGTLFLDEVGELEPRMQAKLLRVLDGAGYYRLGGVRKVTVNVRVLAATNRRLDGGHGSTGFRADLYHRLAQVHLEVPPLRARREDIGPLAEHFLWEYSSQLKLSPEARRALESYTWPGNVRELRNVVLKAALSAADAEIREGDLPEAVLGAAGDGGSSVAWDGEADLNLQSAERRLIQRALESTDGRKQRAADLLGISLRTLSRKLKSYGAVAGSPGPSRKGGR